MEFDTYDQKKQAFAAYLRHLKRDSRDPQDIDALSEIMRFLYNDYQDGFILRSQIVLLNYAAKFLDCGFIHQAIDCLLKILTPDNTSDVFLDVAADIELETAQAILKISSPQYFDLKAFYQNLWSHNYVSA